MTSEPTIVVLEKIDESPRWKVLFQENLLGHVWPVRHSLWHYDIRFFYCPWACEFGWRPQFFAYTRAEGVRDLLTAYFRYN